MENEQRSEQWFKDRTGRVTGSVVGAILGLAPYMTREDVMRSMVRDYHGAEREFQGNVATDYGTANEDGARLDYELETGNGVQDAYFVKLADWLGASPDGYVGDDGLLEIKCPYGKRNGGEFKPLSEQLHYYAQIQVQLLCTGRKWCDFYQWSPHGTNLERVEYDQEWISYALSVLSQFYAEYLSEIDNPEHLEPLRVVINTQETNLIIEEIDQLKEAQDNAKARQKELEQKLVDLAKGKNAEIWGRKLTRVERKGAVSYAKLVKDHAPDVDVEQYRGKSSEFWKLS